MLRAASRAAGAAERGGRRALPSAPGSPARSPGSRSRCPEQREGTGPRVSWKQQGPGFSLGRPPAEAPGIVFEGRLWAHPTCADGQGEPLPRRTRSSSRLREVCSVRPPAAVWTKTTKEPTKNRPRHPVEKLGSGLMPGPGFTPFLSFTHLGCNATDSYFAQWTKQLLRAFEV